MGTEWSIRFYTEADGSVPVQEFLTSADLTPGELKQLRLRLDYIRQMGLSALGQRADILETLEGKDATGLYSLRCPNTPNNPRILLCAVVERTFVLLHGFKEQNARDYAAAITVAQRRRQALEKARSAAQQAQATPQRKGKRR
ncbi:hypothetical protein RDMS_07255 [Deinococcus sp. RL]|uniref:type II toxin-antitoxin system RelE/ParE family toxin n=1 Tax=Deinococcus sp. RL TaxID=1489678 RepID=UPI0004D98296|nr:type II toxin-antitoxin system RelE/ParE family toxin [Deinococcus sp. RL]KEF34438.1 hypothetical protein RDMS_07255 [Deinococcus sp. RL]